MMAGGPSEADYELCLPLTNDIRESEAIYQSILLRWFRDHPELRGLSEMSGGYQATVAVFKCKR